MGEKKFDTQQYFRNLLELIDIEWITRLILKIHYTQF
ncbi:MAG: hypothetical protein RL331_1879 [Bacteroidota bacterium]|jgi:hypothetical protein